MFVFLSNLSEPKTVVKGGPDLYIDAGSTLNLTCVVRFSPEPPPYIFWYHGDKVSSALYHRDKFSSALYHGDKFTALFTTAASNWQDECHLLVPGTICRYLALLVQSIVDIVHPYDLFLKSPEFGAVTVLLA